MGFQNATHFANFTPRAVLAAEGFQDAAHFANFMLRAMLAAVTFL
ncbi:hypothetical protein NRA47_17430 [Acinetobacter baumannii]|nr:hypothetical protein [Acinetobacter baumannii]